MLLGPSRQTHGTCVSTAGSCGNNNSTGARNCLLQIAKRVGVLAAGDVAVAALHQPGARLPCGLKSAGSAGRR